MYPGFVPLFRSSPDTLNARWAQILFDRIQDIAEEAKDSAKMVRQEAETSRKLAAEDRERLAHLLTMLERAAESSVRIEEAAKVVASDLEAAHSRADSVTGAAGEAADAASKSH